MKHSTPGTVSRRIFLAAGTGSATALAADEPHPPAAAAAPPSPFADPDFGFTAQIVLGSAYYRQADPGKVLAILARIEPGNFESAWKAFHDAGVEAQGLAQAALSQRHSVSAREAYLWAAGYFKAALRALDGTKEPERMLPCWKEYAACWSAAAGLFDPPAERLEIPYEGAALTAWFLRAGGSRGRKPLIILNNGADGLESSMYALGGSGALARGYNCLIFNGPGQGDSLWARKIYFRPDWEKVVTPVVDTILRHREVDPKRIALVGVSQGGYWAPRALAFEHRIAAGVADPGVWDVSAPWLQHLPKFVRDLLDGGKQVQFDKVMAGAAANPKTAGLLRFRMRPFGMASYYDVFRAVERYNLADVAGRIQCPMLITDPEGEPFFPGQAPKLYDALRCPKKLVRFTQEQGADQHCEVAAPGYRDYIIHNWLAETLG